MRKTLQIILCAAILAGMVTMVAGCEAVLRKLNPEAAVAQAQEATEAIETAEFDIKVEMESGGVPITLSGSGAMEVPLSFEMSGTMTIDDKAFPFEQRMLDGKQYMKTSVLGDAWWLIGSGQADPMQLGASAPNEYFAYFEVVESAQDFGNRSVRGTECQHLLLEIDEERLSELLGSAATSEARAAMASSEMAVEVWIALDTGLPMREVVVTTMRIPGAGAPVRIQGQIDFTAFDTAVEIVAPQGAQPLPAQRQ